MNSIKKEKIFIIDASAVLSGKPINLEDAKMVTTPGVSNEFQPGGRDYQAFQFLIEKGLTIISPSKESIIKINGTSKETGDIERLSDADKELLALSLELSKKNEAILITDDYSIQNVANSLDIKFESISQRGIKKRFKWSCRCQGCGKKFKENIKICPICGSKTKNIVFRKKYLKKQ